MMRQVAAFLVEEYARHDALFVDLQPIPRAEAVDALVHARDALSKAAVRLLNAAVQLESRAEQPIPMLIHCPLCGKRHIDLGPFATEPHSSHACQHCGHVWKPALEPTVGVQFLPGYKDKGRVDLSEGRCDACGVSW
jgi:transposase-like protein